MRSPRMCMSERTAPKKWTLIQQLRQDPQMSGNSALQQSGSSKSLQSIVSQDSGEGIIVRNHLHQPQIQVINEDRESNEDEEEEKINMGSDNIS